MSHISNDSSIAQAFFHRLINAWHEGGIGHDIELVLSGAGISRSQIDQGEVYMRDYFRALQIAAPMAANTGVFLRAGRSQSLFDLGIVGYALYSAPNLRRSWDMSVGQSVGLVPHPITITRRVSDRFAGIVLHPPQDDPLTRRAFCEEWLFGTWRWMCQRLPELTHCTTATLHLNYPSPAYRQLYADSFPGSIAFNMPETALWIPRAYYEKPFESANALIMRLCHQKSLVKTVRPENDNDWAAEVRLYLLQNARAPFPGIEDAAQNFRVPTHTLHRRLTRQGTTFRRVKLEVKWCSRNST